MFVRSNDLVSLFLLCDIPRESNKYLMRRKNRSKKKKNPLYTKINHLPSFPFLSFPFHTATKHSVISSHCLAWKFVCSTRLLAWEDRSEQ